LNQTGDTKTLLDYLEIICIISNQQQLEQGHSRFVENVGLSNSDLLKKLASLDTVWSKFWPTIYDTKYIGFLQTEILDHPQYSKAWMKATQHYNAVKKSGGFQDTFSK
jgi:hypothetical protein